MHIVLTSVTDPDRKISAVRDLRVATGLGLRETLDIVNRVPGTRNAPFPGRSPQTVSVTRTDGLSDSFTWHVLGADTNTSEAVTDFLLDLLAMLSYTTAQDVMAMDSYKALKQAIR